MTHIWRCANVYFHFLGQITVLGVTVLKIWFFDSRATQLLVKSRNSLIWESIFWLTISHYLFFASVCHKDSFQNANWKWTCSKQFFFHDSFISRQQKWLIKSHQKFSWFLNSVHPRNFFFFVKLYLPKTFFAISRNNVNLLWNLLISSKSYK